MKKMRFKPGDRVRIKDMKWYVDNKNKNGEVVCGAHVFTDTMALCCGEVLTIEEIASDNSYFMKDKGYWWTDDMFEGLANEEQDYILHIEKDWDKEQEIQIADGFEFQDENGNTINARKVKIVKKKPKYPATYEECCKVLHYAYGQGITMRGVTKEEEELFRILIVLKRCRDAYWKTAGWKPDWGKNSDNYNLIVYEGEIIKDFNCGVNHVLVFPTSEMRDTFYENFKDLIESCKELL